MWVLMELTVIGAELRKNDYVDVYLKYPYFLSDLDQTWIVCSKCAQ